MDQMRLGWRNFKIKPPCDRECPDRHVGCHSECEKYIKYRKELTALNQKIQDENNKQFM